MMSLIVYKTEDYHTLCSTEDRVFRQKERKNVRKHHIYLSILILVSSCDNDSPTISNGECRICVPSLNMCFITNRLQPLNLQGNIFDVSKLVRPLTIQDYINILLNNDKHMDSELAHMINNIQSLTERYRRLNETEKCQGDTQGKFQVSLF